ncbi:cyclin-dependent kinase 2-associated protein 1-like [Panonychus citri]|uniref:cyclin-dependent kinase 2-associated protein 1-like n=1 Tax=Panonychus citri TaxID=50023 RepID=UPI002307271C|nr:cyclin-dependent kinase 2-associated protein 1-like [Panonychus citri]
MDPLSFNNSGNSNLQSNFIPNEMNLSLGGNQQFQQNFLTGGPPTLVVIPSNIPLYPGYQTMGGNSSTTNGGNGNGGNGGQSTSKYNQLLTVIDEMSKDVRPIYSGSKTSTDRFKRGLIHARVLIRECILEMERGGGGERSGGSH